MKRSSIPRPGSIPRPQQAGSRLPQLQPRAPLAQAVAKRAIVPPRTAPKVLSAPVIAGGSASTARKRSIPVRPSRLSFGLPRKVPGAAAVSVPVAAPVVATLPPSPVPVVPDVVEVIPQPVIEEPVAGPLVPLRTPVIFPRRRFRYTDPGNELFNQPPTPLYNESVLLQRPSNGKTVIMDVAVNPRPVVVTDSGEHIVCDVSLNVREPPMSLVPNRVPRPEGFIRERRRRARKAPDAIVGEDLIPETPSLARDYADSPLSILKKRRFARRILNEGGQPAGFYKLINTKKVKFPVSQNLDTSIEWEPVEPVVPQEMNYVNLLSPFQEYNLITFSPEPFVDYGDMDLIQFS